MRYAHLNENNEVVNVIEADRGYELMSPERIKIIDGLVVGVGHVYDPENNEFIPPKPYPSWVLRETPLTPGHKTWYAPVDQPQDAIAGETTIQYHWDEESQSWNLI